MDANMRTVEEYQLAIDEISKVCEKHGIFLVGTDTSEGIYGEITIGDSSDIDGFGWKDVGEKIDNNVKKNDYIGRDAYVAGIGVIKQIKL